MGGHEEIYGAWLKNMKHLTMNKYIAILLLSLSILSFGTPAFADFQKGYDAYNSGDFATALKEWRPLAEQEIAAAQYNLGNMYFNGQGVIQDYTRAHMWWNIAASQGDQDAIGNRDAVTKQLTPADISKAQDMARECVAKDYKGC